MNKAKVVPIYHENSGCSYHRVYLPYLKLGYAPVTTVKYFDVDTLYIFNREFPNVQVKDAVSMGLKYIVDIDDYWHLDVSHPMYVEYCKNRVSDRYEGFIKNALAVTVTNISLYNKVKKLNNNVFIIPNTIPFNEDQFKLQKPSNSGRFVYAGSHSHLQDIRLIADAVNHANIDFTLAGYSQRNEQSRLMFGEFTQAKKEINKSVSTYMTLYNNKSISLVPLVGTEFDTCKSNLKMIEAACKGLHVIASKTQPYYTYLDREYLDFADNQYQWYEKIKYCKANPSYVEDRAYKLQDFCLEYYNMKDANELRQQVIDYVYKNG